MRAVTLTTEEASFKTEQNANNIEKLVNATSIAEATKYYRQLSLQIHPDKVDTSNRETASQLFKEINEIYTIKKEMLDKEVSAAFEISSEKHPLVCKIFDKLTAKSFSKLELREQSIELLQVIQDNKVYFSGIETFLNSIKSPEIICSEKFLRDITKRFNTNPEKGALHLLFQHAIEIGNEATVFPAAETLLREFITLIENYHRHADSEDLSVHVPYKLQLLETELLGVARTCTESKGIFDGFHRLFGSSLMNVDGIRLLAEEKGFTPPSSPLKPGFSASAE